MIDLSYLREHPVAVLGLGRTGLTAAIALYKSGVQVWAWDDAPAQVEAAREAGIDVTDLNTADLSGIEYLVLSPGIPHTHPAPHPIVTRAREAGLTIVSDIDLLFGADPHARYVCITGTNGKSTTTALVGHILRECGVRCQVGGNLGQGVLGFEQLGQGGVYVIEMSSYQIEITHALTPNIAVLLNITPDHLDRHGGMEGYVAAKESLFRKGARRQIAIVCIDDKYCRDIARRLEAEKHFEVFTLSLTGIQAPLMVDDGVMISVLSGTAADLGNVKALRGKHNWENMAAAFYATRAIGIAPRDILQAMESFPGLEHRQQLVAEIDGVSYINDSKATNANAAEKALSSYDVIYWIAGGQPKDGGLNGLERMMKRVRHAFLIGDAETQFATWLEGRAAYTRCGTLDVALKTAHDLAQSEHVKGAVILLSPACASFDQFKSFEHRGNRFIELVHELQNGVAA